MSKMLPIGNRVMDRAYMRDGNTLHTGEALMLACLLHAHGKRGTDDEAFLRKIMKDHNLERPKK